MGFPIPLGATFQWSSVLYSVACGRYRGERDGVRAGDLCADIAGC